MCAGHENKESCSLCHGLGKTAKWANQTHEEWSKFPRDCPSCGGYGWVLIVDKTGVSGV